MISPAWPASIDHAAFTRLLAQHLPQVHAQIDAGELGNLHCEMAAFERAALELYALNPKLCMTHFEFANEVLKRATPDVQNAIEVSFLEGFLFGNAAQQQAYNHMPSELRAAYAALRTANQGF